MTGTLLSEAPEGPTSGIDGDSTERVRSAPNLGRVVGLCMALIGVFIGSGRLSDNSFLTHLATGRQMISDGIVRSDVFTWTSQGKELVVQSWLASLLYGVVDEIGGFGGLRLLMAVTAGLLGWIAWILAEETRSLFTRLVIMAPVLVVGGVMWSERPLLIGLALFGLTLVVVGRSDRLPVLAVVGFVWIGVHGSWPLGLVLLAGRAAGSLFDRDDPRPDLRAMSWLGGGMLVGGVVNPYGPELLLFPFRLLSDRETLSHVAEWQSPSFGDLYSRAFLAMVMLLIIAVTREKKWRTLGPAMLFIAAAMASRRNIPMAMFAAIPVLAAGLPSLGRLSGGESSAMITRIGRLLVGLVVVSPILLIRAPHVDMSDYPVAAVDAMESMGLSPAEVHVVHPDFVGNYLDLRYGDSGAAWIDDRYELHDATLMSDYLMLFSIGPGWSEVLDESGGVALLWQRSDPLTQLVGEVAGWRTVWSDDDWTVLCRPDASECANSPEQD